MESSPSVVSMGTQQTLRHMETFLSPEKVFLPYSQSPLFSDPSIIRDSLMPEDKLLLLLQERPLPHLSKQVPQLLLEPSTDSEESQDVAQCSHQVATDSQILLEVVQDPQHHLLDNPPAT